MLGMRLKSLGFMERGAQPREWSLDGLTLGRINLIVGTNATGKTKTMNVIRNFAQLFTPKPKYRPRNSRCDFTFDHNGRDYRYILRVEDGKVVEEEVRSGEGDDPLLLRRPNGVVEIFAEQEGKSLSFRPPDTELAAVARRDSLQHKFLEPLHEWAIAVRYFAFGGSLGKENAAIAIIDGPEADERDSKQVVPIFRKGKERYNEVFSNAILQDMKRLHYDLEEIDAIVPQRGN